MRLSILRRVAPAISFPPSDAEIIEQLKRQLAAAATQQRSCSVRGVPFLSCGSQLLEERLRLQRIAKYGPGSEKLTSAQLELLELEPGVSKPEVEPRANASRCRRRTSQAQASGRPDVASGSSARGTSRSPARRSSACAAAAARDDGDRLRRERAVGCGAGEVLRAGDQAREACLQAVRRAGVVAAPLPHGSSRRAWSATGW